MAEVRRQVVKRTEYGRSRFAWRRGANGRKWEHSRCQAHSKGAQTNSRVSAQSNGEQ